MKTGRPRVLLVPAILSFLLATATWVYVKTTSPPSDVVQKEKPEKHVVLEPIVIKAHHPHDCDILRPFPQMVLVPNFKSTWLMIHKCESPNSRATSTVLTIFYSNWVKEFGDPKAKVRAALNDLMIEWGDAVRPVRSAYTVDGTYVENGFATGLALSPSYIWVYFDESKSISQGSLVHELVHISLWALNDHPDSDHEGSVHPGWSDDHTRFIVKLNKHLFSLGY